MSIEPPDNVHSTLRMEDLHHGDDNDDKFQQYEKKIDTLMTQVGSLKSQVLSNIHFLFHLSVATVVYDVKLTVTSTPVDALSKIMSKLNPSDLW